MTLPESLDALIAAVKERVGRGMPMDPAVVIALARVAQAADLIFNGHHGEDESTLIDPLRSLAAALGADHEA